MPRANQRERGPFFPLRLHLSVYLSKRALPTTTPLPPPPSNTKRQRQRNKEKKKRKDAVDQTTRARTAQRDRFVHSRLAVHPTNKSFFFIPMRSCSFFFHFCVINQDRGERESGSRFKFGARSDLLSLPREPTESRQQRRDDKRIPFFGQRQSGRRKGIRGRPSVGPCPSIQTVAGTGTRAFLRCHLRRSTLSSRQKNPQPRVTNK